jgi:hypothetical protein
MPQAAKNGRRAVTQDVALGGLSFSDLRFLIWFS